jgi:hypothetical protein
MIRRLVPIVAVVLALAGCSTDSADPAPPPTTSTTAAVPAVDLGSFAEHPCSTLTAAQQGRLGFPPRLRETAGEWAGTCRWAKTEDDNVNYFVTLNLRSDALAEAYEQKDARDPGGELRWKSFAAREIGGLAAVARSYHTIGAHCEVIVDVGDEQSISITGSLLTAPDPRLCDRLVTAAGLVVDAARR